MIFQICTNAFENTHITVLALDIKQKIIKAYLQHGRNAYGSVQRELPGGTFDMPDIRGRDTAKLRKLF